MINTRYRFICIFFCLLLYNLMMNLYLYFYVTVSQHSSRQAIICETFMRYKIIKSYRKIQSGAENLFVGWMRTREYYDYYFFRVCVLWMCVSFSIYLLNLFVNVSKVGAIHHYHDNYFLHTILIERRSTHAKMPETCSNSRCVWNDSSGCMLWPFAMRIFDSRALITTSMLN